MEIKKLNILEVLFKEGFSIRQLDLLIDPNLSGIIDTIMGHKGDLSTLIAIISCNGLNRIEDLDYEAIEEAVREHYEG